MSSNKRYNQLLFLTTLSVYLGLVLAGGASPALAQAAMAKGFDIKTALESKDDLDKKPNDEEKKQVSQSLDNYFNTSKWFLEELQRLSAFNEFDQNFGYLSIGKRLALPCGTDKTGKVLRELTGSTYIESQTLRPQLEPSIAQLADRLGSLGTLSDCIARTNTEWANTSEIGIEVWHKESGFEIEISLLKHSPLRASQLADALSFAFQSCKSGQNDRTATLLHENTRITSENDQVFIVTNLPRAGLDSLLAAK